MIPKTRPSQRAAGWGGKKLSPFKRGRDERPFCLFIDDASLLDGELTTSILRGFVGHPLLEVHTTAKTSDPHLEVEVADGGYPEDGARVLIVGSHKEGAGFVRNASQKRELASRYMSNGDDDVEELARRIILADYAELHGADALATASPELRTIATDGVYASANIMSPSEAVALVGLFLRLRQDFAYHHSGASSASYGKQGFYGLLARDLLPAAGRWLDTCPTGDVWRTSPYRLAKSVLVRIERVLYSRDHIHEHHLIPQNLQASDDALFYFDAFLFSLAGAFDAIARVVHAACGMRDNPRRAKWRDKKGKSGSWTDELAAKAPRLADLMALEKPHRDVLEIVFLLRNLVHADGLSSVPVIKDPERVDIVDHQLLLPSEDNPAFLSSFERIGGLRTWGVEQIDRDAYSMDIPNFVETVLPRVLTAMGEIMDFTPVETLGGQAVPSADSGLDARAREAVQRLRLLSGLA